MVPILVLPFPDAMVGKLLMFFKSWYTHKVEVIIVPFLWIL